MERKIYIMENLGCANCAAKMEAAINKIDGVNAATLNFLTLKLKIDADDARFESIMDEVEAVCHKIEPDCVIKR